MSKRSTATLPTPLTQASLMEWLRTFVADRAGLVADEIGADVPFEAFGLDSRSAVQASGALEKALGLRLAPGLLYTYPTLAELSGHLSSELGCAEPR